MSEDNNHGYEILSKGELVMLRTRVEADREHYTRWQIRGEWRSFDAPWEHVKTEEKKKSDAVTKQPQTQEAAFPHKFAVIATLDNLPLGWVNRYGGQRNPSVWFVGIDICEDAYLNHGCGTEALDLWVNYLFENSDYHKLCLETWSFNPRMVRVAEKIGFISEGCQREMQFWQDEWLDLLHFGMLREEWKARRERN